MKRYIDVEISKTVYTNVALAVPDNWTDDEIQSGMHNSKIAKVIKESNSEWFSGHEDDIKICSISEYPENRRNQTKEVV